MISLDQWTDEGKHLQLLLTLIVKRIILNNIQYFYCHNFCAICRQRMNRKITIQFLKKPTHFNIWTNTYVEGTMRRKFIYFQEQYIPLAKCTNCK